jgi:hypothetical protein
MSEVKVGDRVRVVIEADVLEASNFDGDGIMLEAWNYVPPVGVCGVVSVEVIPAPFVLPTKMYAQVIGSDGYLWTRMVPAPSKLEFVWAGLGTPSLWATDENLLGDSGLRVISEGVDDE